MAYLPLLLIGLGIGFFAANVRVFVQFLRFARLRRSALLIWPGRRPPFYPLLFGLGAVLSVVIVYKLLVLRLQLVDVFANPSSLIADP
jgi:hypothetical protein